MAPRRAAGDTPERIRLAERLIEEIGAYYDEENAAAADPEGLLALAGERRANDERVALLAELSDSFAETPAEVEARDGLSAAVGEIRARAEASGRAAGLLRERLLAELDTLRRVRAVAESWRGGAGARGALVDREG